MPDDLAAVAAASPENIEIASKGIASETLLHLQSQAAHAAPHVRVPRRDPYPHAGGDWDPGLPDRSPDRKSVVWGMSGSVRVDVVGRRVIKKKTKTKAKR